MLDGFENKGQTVTFSNGKTFSVYEKETKKGTRYYYWSGRMLPVSKKDINQNK